MAKHAYTGDVEQTYPQYLDVGGGAVKTLVARPGETYDIQAADGWDLPVPPGDGRWKTAKAKADVTSEEH